MGLAPSSSLTDSSGQLISGQDSGAQHALDVGVSVGGVQVDPRQTRALSSGQDSVAVPGVATAGKQDAGNASLASIDSKFSSGITSRPVVGTLTDRSGTATTSDSVMMATNAARKYLLVQNVGTKAMAINFGAAAALGTAGSIALGASASFVMEGSFVSSESVHVIAAGTNAYTAKEV